MQSSLGIDYGTNSVRALIVLGAAVSAGIIAAIHKDFHTAQSAMTSLKDIAYSPEPENQRTYNDLYRLYRMLHDAFGGVNRNAELSTVMKELIAIKKKQNKS
jgi:L-ribulokinase